MFEYETALPWATIGTTNQGELRLSLVHLHNYEPCQIDFRLWKPDGKGGLRPGKGMTLTDEQAAALATGLIKYLEEAPVWGGKETITWTDVWGKVHTVEINR